MRPAIHKALLVIADISGFTQFMKSHESAADHAMQVVVELLKAVIAAAAPPLKLVEVEGDAAFFYAICKEDGDNVRELAAIKRQVMRFFDSFNQTRQRLCASYPCARNAQALRLKVIIHTGEVALEHIHGFDKLFGMDVILAHRLLKNSVAAQEYVLMTAAAHNRLGNLWQLQPTKQTEYCEGIGIVETVVFHPAAQRPGVGIEPNGKSRATANQLLPKCNFFDKSPERLWGAPSECLLFAPHSHGTRAQQFKTAWLHQHRIGNHHRRAIHLAVQGWRGLSRGPAP